MISERRDEQVWTGGVCVEVKWLKKSRTSFYSFYTAYSVEIMGDLQGLDDV